MRSRVRLAFLTLLAILAFSVVLPVAAQGQVLEGDRAVFGGTFVLKRGQIMRGDLAVFGGTARVEEGARLEGDMALVGGTATVAGEVDGDVALFGGTLRLEETALVRGNVAALGGTVDRAPGAVVEGDVIENSTVQIGPPALGFLERGVVRVQRSPFALLLSALGALVRTVIVTLVLAGVAFLVALYLPNHLRRVAHAAEEAPATSFGVGCVTLPIASLLGLVLAVTIIGIPVALVLWLALMAAWFFGLIGLGHLLGERLLRAADVRFPRPTAAAVVGVVVLWLLWSAAGLVPWGGGLLIRLVIVSLAVGAVLLTRFGTLVYPNKPASPEHVLPAWPEWPDVPPDERSGPPAPPEASGPSQPPPD